MSVVESGGSQWTQAVAAFGLGLISAGLIEYLRERTRRKRMIGALRLEIERNRGLAIATNWEIAIAERRVTPLIAKRTLEVIDADPVRAAAMDPDSIAQLRALIGNGEACQEFNRNAPGDERWIAPPPLAMVVYAAQTEALGHMSREAGTAIMNVYAAIPGINRIAEDMQSSARSVAYLDPTQHLLANRIRRELTSNQATLGRLYDILIADSDRAIALLAESPLRRAFRRPRRQDATKAR
jgi:hypothetical protein